MPSSQADARPATKLRLSGRRRSAGETFRSRGRHYNRCANIIGAIIRLPVLTAVTFLALTSAGYAIAGNAASV